jgi:uncharacterized protein YuzB (UPF0349 family)
MLRIDRGKKDVSVTVMDYCLVFCGIHIHLFKLLDAEKVAEKSFSTWFRELLLLNIFSILSKHIFLANLFKFLVLGMLFPLLCF